MADNVAITAGSGTSIAADDIASVFYQRVKIGLGADGTAVDAVGGAGAVGTGVQRVTLASDDPAVTDLAAMEVLLGTIDTDTGAMATLLGTIDADTGGILTSVQLIDDAVYTDDVPFTAGSNKVMAAGFRFDDTTPDAVQQGDVGYARMSSRRELYVTLRDAAGNERGLNVDASGQIAVTVGAALPTGTNNIGDVDIATITAGETHIGEVSTPFDVLTVTPTVSTTPAYTSGDAVGGKQTLTSACRVSGGDTLLQSIVLRDLGNQKQPLTILFFDSDPTAATITDNDAFAFSTDISKLIGKVNILAADYETVDSEAVAVLSNIGLLLKASGSANLYAAIVTTGTPTYTGTSDIVIKYGFAQG